MRLLRVITPLATALVSCGAYATCDAGSTTVFACSTSKGKKIEVCDGGSTITYSFGKPKAQPDIVVKVPRNQASTGQWPGVGRNQWYSIDIPNGSTKYSVFWSVDRLAESGEIHAGVNVIIDGKTVATVKCLERGLIQEIEGIDLKPTP